MGAAGRILGIPYADVMYARILVAAYPNRTDFKPGCREPLDRFIHSNIW